MSPLALILVGILFLGATSAPQEVHSRTISVEPTTTIEDTRTTSPVVEDTTQTLRTVPFYSQFADITSAKWQKVGCGIASLAMVMEYHKPNTVSSVDTLLEEGIDAGAYTDAGWTYKGLIQVSGKYGFTGESHDLAGSVNAFSQFEKAVARGPVIASVYYTFEPGHPIPHLVVVNAIDEDTVYYNDPAEKTGNGSISIEDFKKAWKKRYIEIYPAS